MIAFSLLVSISDILVSFHFFYVVVLEFALCIYI